jgi:drug/metabolite transporter (DMT)-like permease
MRSLYANKRIRLMMIRLRKCIGFIYAILSAFFLAFSNVLIKKSTIFNGSEQAVIRYVFQLVIMIIIGLVTKNNLLGPIESRKILIIRGLCGMTYLLSLHFSVKLIAPSDTVSLLHLNIIIVSILARIFLNEKINLAHIFSVVLSTIGVFLIAQPSFIFSHLQQSQQFVNLSISTNNSNLSTTNIKNNELFLINDDMKKIIGIGLALLSSFAISFQSIILKKLSNNKVHYSISIVYGCYFGLPVSFILSIVLFIINNNSSQLSQQILMYNDNSEDLFELTSLLIFQCIISITSALSGIISQILMNLALDHEDASRVSMLRSTELFFTFLLQFILLAIYPNMFKVVGACLICIGTFFILIYKLIDNSVSRKTSYVENDTNNEDQQQPMECIEYLKKFLLYKF